MQIKTLITTPIYYPTVAVSVPATELESVQLCGPSLEFLLRANFFFTSAKKHFFFFGDQRPTIFFMLCRKN